MTNQKAETEEELAVIYSKILVSTISCCLGWPVFMFAFSNSMNPFFMLIGGAIVSAPVLFVLAMGGEIKDVFRTDKCDLLTSYSDCGHSPGCGKSSVSCHILKIFIIIIAAFFGCFITVGLLFFMIVKYTGLYMRAGEKPPFFKSAFPIMTALVIIIGSGILFYAT